MSANWTEKEWKTHIEDRRRGSTLWQFIHALGSLRLAMLLLISILIACAVATLYESKFTAEVAQAYVYKAPWFVFWLAVLCINLFCVTLTRWPWRPKHYGFVITHYGIIILLVGAAIGQKLGFEANVTLRKGEAPTRELVVNRTVLQIQSRRDLESYKVPINVTAKPATPERPITMRLLGTPVKLRVEKSTWMQEVPVVTTSPLPGQGPGAMLEFRSAMMEQTLPVNLVLKPEEMSQSDFFGRADIRLLPTLPDRTGATPPEKVVKETQVVFARGNESVVTPRDGHATGYRFGLVMPESGEPEIVVELAGMPTPKGPQTRRETFPLSAVLGKPFTLSGETVEVLVRNYWPDMEMREGKPVTKSEEPNNPAILVLLSGYEGADRPLLEVAVVEEVKDAEEAGKPMLHYQMSRHGVVAKSGKAAEGESFLLGWADWEATVNTALLNAIMGQRLKEVPEDSNSERVVPALYARLIGPKGEEGEPQWILSGRGVSLALGNETVFVGYGLDLYTLPFTLELLNFEVPRYRGSTKPMDFRSTVRFRDDRTEATADSLIHMNHPAGFPQGFWLTALGKNYKFSQARWNAKDLNETTLQVLHDPGWPAKWIGSILICVGITIMFYAPKPSQRRKKGAGQKAAASQEEEAAA